MQPWQWFLGTLEFIAAWTAVEVFNFWRKYRAMLSDEREGQPPLTEHLKWIAEQDTAKDDEFLQPGQIPDDWRKIMARKEMLYRQHTARQTAQRKGLDYSWWPDT